MQKLFFNLALVAVMITFFSCSTEKKENRNTATQNQNFGPGAGNMGQFTNGGFYVTAKIQSGTASSSTATTYSASNFKTECDTASSTQNVIELILKLTKKSDGNEYETTNSFKSACVNKAKISVLSLAAGDTAILTVNVRSVDGSTILLAGTTEGYTQKEIERPTPTAMPTARPTAMPSPMPSGMPQGGRQNGPQEAELTEVDISMAVASQGISKLAISGAALSQAVKACGALAIKSQDSSGNAVTLTSQVALSLSTSSSTGTFYSDSGCSSAITSVLEPAASSSVTVYYKDTTAGSYTLKAAEASGLLGWTAASGTATIK
jgi:hypothetical protein